MAEKIDAEVSNFISRAYKTAAKIIKEKRAALNKIAQVLIEKETVEQQEFNELMKELTAAAAMV